VLYSALRPAGHVLLVSEGELAITNDAGKKTLPAFEEMVKRIEAIPLRAFDLFEKGGSELGHDVEDWLNAERRQNWYELQVTLPGSASLPHRIRSCISSPWRPEVSFPLDLTCCQVRHRAWIAPRVEVAHATT